MEPLPLPPPLPVPQPPPAPSTYRFSKTGLLLAVLLIVGCVMFVLRMQEAHREEENSSARRNVTLELLARYAVGVKGLMDMGGQKMEPALVQAVMKDVNTLAKHDTDALRVLILKSWMNGEKPADAAVNELVSKHPGLAEDALLLQGLQTGEGTKDTALVKKLRQHHGWFADLARTSTLPAEDPVRQAVMQQGIGTAAVLLGVSSLGLLMAVGGLVLFILGIVRWRAGKLRLDLPQRSGGDGGVMIEGFALYLALFLCLPGLVRDLPLHLPPWAPYAGATLALLSGLLWPRLRGMPRASWRGSLGLHRGTGFLREVGAGLVGWLAALPLLVVGIIAASWIAKLTGDLPSHPIVDVFAGDGWAKFGAVMLAVVWAPVSEELMFRGLLFPGLSAWLRWLPGALMSAFVFAVIHPQGWAGVPAIMALAMTFSTLRQWRQSVIAPMTAHALNNGLMCTMMMLLF